MREARLRYDSMYSKAVQRNSPSPSTIRPVSSLVTPHYHSEREEIQLLKTQVASLQSQIQEISNCTIPVVVKSVNDVKSDIKEVKS